MTGIDPNVGMFPEEPDEGGGGLDFGALLGQAQEMLSKQAEAAEEVVVGRSGGGAVKVEVTGAWEFRSVSIDPDALDDAEQLEDLVLAALRDAAAQVASLQLDAMGGVDLGGLGGLLGGPPE